VEDAVVSNLELEFYCDDLDRDLSIREYLSILLLTLWKEGEGFSGKRPFGNSGWDRDLYKPLVKAGVINGSLYDDGYLEDYDAEAGRAEIKRLICEMCDVEIGDEE